MPIIINSDSSELFTRIWHKKSCPKVFLPSRNKICTRERNGLGDFDCNTSRSGRRRSRSRESNKYEQRTPPPNFFNDFSDVRTSYTGDAAKRNSRGRSPPTRDKHHSISIIDNYSCSYDSDASVADEWEDPVVVNRRYSAKRSNIPRKRRRGKSLATRNRSQKSFNDSNPARSYRDSRGWEDWEDALMEDKNLLTQAAIGLCLCLGLTFCLS